MTVRVYLRQYDHHEAEAHIFITVVGCKVTVVVCIYIQNIMRERVEESGEMVLWPTTTTAPHI